MEEGYVVDLTIGKIPLAVRRENPDVFQDFLQKHAWRGEENIIH